MESRIALDTPALRRLIAALTTAPAAAPDDETVALVRIYLYVTAPVVLPSVSEELGQTGDVAAGSWRHLQFSEAARYDDYFHGCVKGKTETYLGYHPDPRDCHVVAEAECAKLEAFLTTSDELLNGLGGRTETILVTRPSHFWRNSKPVPGATPRVLPAPDSLLALVDWWRW